MEFKDFGPISKHYIVEPLGRKISMPDPNLGIAVPPPTTPIVATEFVKHKIAIPIDSIKSNTSKSKSWISKIKTKHIVFGVLILSVIGVAVWNARKKKKEKT